MLASCDALTAAGNAIATLSARFRVITRAHAGLGSTRGTLSRRFLARVGRVNTFGTQAGQSNRPGLVRRGQRRRFRVVCPARARLEPLSLVVLRLGCVTLCVAPDLDADQVSDLLGRRCGHQLRRRHVERGGQFADVRQPCGASAFKALDCRDIDAYLVGQLALSKSALSTPVAQRRRGDQGRSCSHRLDTDGSESGGVHTHDRIVPAALDLHLYGVCTVN
jgi:hypothetical protein